MLCHVTLRCAMMRCTLRHIDSFAIYVCTGMSYRYVIMMMRWDGMGRDVQDVVWYVMLFGMLHRVA